MIPPRSPWPAPSFIFPCYSCAVNDSPKRYLYRHFLSAVLFFSFLHHTNLRCTYFFTKPDSGLKWRFIFLVWVQMFTPGSVIKAGNRTRHCVCGPCVVLPVLPERSTRWRQSVTSRSTVAVYFHVLCFLQRLELCPWARHITFFAFSIAFEKW